MDCSTPGFPVLHCLLEFAQIHVSDVIQRSHLLCLLLLLPSIFPWIRVFSNESALHIRWPKDWSFSISPSNKYSRLISFKIDWLVFLAAKGLSRVFSSTAVQKHRSSALNLPLEKEMATHSSVLAWRIPGKGEPGGLLSMGSHRVRHD